MDNFDELLERIYTENKMKELTVAMEKAFRDEEFLIKLTYLKFASIFYNEEVLEQKIQELFYEVIK